MSTATRILEPRFSILPVLLFSCVSTFEEWSQLSRVPLPMYSRIRALNSFPVWSRLEHRLITRIRFR
ncbi:hypothetical protein PVAP13_8KG059622 [Panicum virgatum]|uniref:Uncharacterized protein n=1 Tax=Panicum virgatum TaxID=38727 RepID=A0A8T0PPV2_PANVG|nr:hypothetical protein PVAP13_8KG059622 [Panicum virgatum]